MSISALTYRDIDKLFVQNNIESVDNPVWRIIREACAQGAMKESRTLWERFVLAQFTMRLFASAARAFVAHWHTPGDTVFSLLTILLL